jgi:hypothetical protein
VYHVELNEYPHLARVHNVSEQRLHDEVVTPFVRGQIFEIGDHKWIPQRTKLTIIESPELPLSQLGLGRGWNTAVRRGEDVTAAVLGAARANQILADGLPPRAPGLEGAILDRCKQEPLSLLGVWQLAAVEDPDASAGARLVLAENAVSELLLQGVIELCRGAKPSAPALSGADSAEAVAEIDEWRDVGGDSLLIRAAVST